MDLKQLFLVVRQRWISVVSVVALALVASAAISLAATPEYAAKARVFISVKTSSSAEALAASNFSASRVLSYASLVESTQLLQRVSRKLGAMSPAKLSREITATVEQDTTIIDLNVQDPSRSRARRIAAVTAAELARYVGTLEKPVGKADFVMKATVVDHASVGRKPVSPRLGLNLTVGALVGLLLGLALALVRDALDGTVKGAGDLGGPGRPRVLGHLQFDPDAGGRPLLTDVAPSSPRSEAFRVLRSEVQFLDSDSPSRAVVVTSPEANAGKTWTAVNLAISMAQTGQRVLLVEGNLRDPKLARILGLRKTVGMTNALTDPATLEECIQHHQESGIDLLAAGPAVPNPAETIQSEAVEKLLAHLGTMYDRVVVDAPPLLPLADAAVLTRHVDGALLVVRHGRTTTSEVTASQERLAAVGGRLLGLVVNMTPKRSSSAYGYRPVATSA